MDVERNHAKTDAELYGTYLQKLGANCNPNSGDPAVKYGSLIIMTMMNNTYCKDSEKHGTPPTEELGPQQESLRQMQLVLHSKVTMVTNIKEKQIRPL